MRGGERRVSGEWRRRRGEERRGEEEEEERRRRRPEAKPLWRSTGDQGGAGGLPHLSRAGN